MVSGIVEVNLIWTALGTDREKALPAFYAFSVADNTGRFSRMGKATWLKNYIKEDHHIITALHMPSQASEVTDDLSTLATFVCAVYSQKGIQIENIPEMRWYLFCKHMAESNKLPPTIGSQETCLIRVHVQAIVWGQA